MTDTDKLEYLIEAIQVMTNAIDNEVPDLALWEIRRTAAKVEEWERA